jgi:beta-galactosidase
MAYTNAEEVELFLNGKSLGKKARGSEPVEIPVGPNVTPERKFVSRYRLLWQVPYQPGSLKAVAYASGREVSSEEIRTAGPAAKVVLIPDRAVIQADGEDLSFITVRVEDKNGNLCPVADNLIHFQVSGAGSIAAVDNGNAATTEPLHANYRNAFNGLALLIVRSREQAGSIDVSATSDGLEKAAIKIHAHPASVTTDRRQTGDAPAD